MRAALLTFVMLASPALAAGMSDPRHDVVLFGDHALEATLAEIDLVAGVVDGGDGLYTVELRFADLAATPRADGTFRFHAEAQFRAEPAGRVLLAYSAEPDGTPFVVAYDAAFRPMAGVTALYDGDADTLTFHLASPAHAGPATDPGASAALFHCVADRGCSRAVLGPESGFALVAVQDAMGASQRPAFVRGGV